MSVTFPAVPIQQNGRTTQRQPGPSLTRGEALAVPCCGGQNVAASGPIREWHQIAVEMLMTDADLALQSISLIFAGDDKEAVARVVHSTRETYDMIRAKRKNLTMSAGDASVLDDKLDRLRARLKFMGDFS